MESFKIYDHSGSTGNYDNNTEGSLTLTAPTGYKHQLTGTVTTNATTDYLTVTDDAASSTLIDQIRSTMSGESVDIGTVASTGETITLTLDTSLPRFYSRGLVVQGTRGIYQEDNQSIWLDGQYDEMEAFYWRKHWGCADDYREKYESPTWVEFLNDGVRGGHGGMDYLVDNIVGSFPKEEELIESARPLVRLQGIHGELMPELSSFSWNRK